MPYQKNTQAYKLCINHRYSATAWTNSVLSLTLNYSLQLQDCQKQNAMIVFDSVSSATTVTHVSNSFTVHADQQQARAVNSVASNSPCLNHSQLLDSMHISLNPNKRSSSSSLGCARRSLTGSLAMLLEDSDNEPTLTDCILPAWDVSVSCNDCVDQPTADETVSVTGITGITSTTQSQRQLMKLSQSPTSQASLAQHSHNDSWWNCLGHRHH